MKKVLLVLTSADELAGEETGYELSEAAHPWKVFRDAGYVVDFASIEGGTPPPYSSSDADDEIVAEFTADETVNAQMLNTPTLGNVDADEYDAVYLVGGHGTMVDFPGSQALQQLLAAMAAKDAVISAVCHGPAGLVDVPLPDGGNLLTGRSVTGFSNAEEDAAGKTAAVPFSLEDRLTEQAGDYAASDPFAENVVVDGKLVTGQNPASAAGVAKEVVKLLTEDVREEKAAEEQAAAELRAEKDAEKQAEEDAAADES